MEGSVSALVLLCLMLKAANAVNVTIPQKLYEVAKGDIITVPCNFKTPDPTKLILIQWLSQGEEVDAEESDVITYYLNGNPDIAPDYTGRVSVDVDIPSGKFNLKLSVTLADSKKFRCHVQVRSDTGKSSALTRLLVLVAPSKPECGIQGKAEYGQNINLTCLSREGFPTPSYSWQSRNVTNNPRPVDSNATTMNGSVLSLFNISKDTSGFFICTSANKIRSATCNLTLTVVPHERTSVEQPSSMSNYVTGGIIAGVVVSLLLLGFVVCCCCYKKKKSTKGDVI